MPTLTIIRGLPGSGKSTFAESLGGIVVEPDMFRYAPASGKYIYNRDDNDLVHSLSVACVMTCMQMNRSVTVTLIGAKKEYYATYIEIGEMFDADIEIYEARGTWGSVHGVSQEEMDRLSKGFEDIPDEYKKYFVGYVGTANKGD